MWNGKRVLILLCSLLLLGSYFLPWVPQDGFLGTNVMGAEVMLVALMFGLPSAAQGAFLLLFIGLGLAYCFLTCLYVIVATLRGRESVKQRRILGIVGVVLWITYVVMNVIWPGSLQMPVGVYLALGSAVVLAIVGSMNSKREAPHA